MEASSLFHGPFVFKCVVKLRPIYLAGLSDPFLLDPLELYGKGLKNLGGFHER